MVIEHTFITTREAGPSLEAAYEYLSARGFYHSSGILSDANPNSMAMEVFRGNAAARKAKNIRELPQTVRVEWDRGRVNVAVSITTSAAWGGNAFNNENPRKTQLHVRLAKSIAAGLENVLAYDRPSMVDYGAWDEVEREIVAIAQRRKRRAITTAVLTFLFFFVLIFVIVAVSGR